MSNNKYTDDARFPQTLLQYCIQYEYEEGLVGGKGEGGVKFLYDVCVAKSSSLTWSCAEENAFVGHGGRPLHALSLSLSPMSTKYSKGSAAALSSIPPFTSPEEAAVLRQRFGAVSTTHATVNDNSTIAGGSLRPALPQVYLPGEVSYAQPIHRMDYSGLTQKSTEPRNMDPRNSSDEGPSDERKTWTKEEDDMVTDLVRKYGTKKWALIGSFLSGRTGKQCRERYVTDPDYSFAILS